MGRQEHARGDIFCCGQQLEQSDFVPGARALARGLLLKAKKKEQQEACKGRLEHVRGGIFWFGQPVKQSVFVPSGPRPLPEVLFLKGALQLLINRYG